jgi:hypothetical protein
MHAELVNSAFDLLVTMFLCIILLVSLETLIKIILIHFVLFFCPQKVVRVVYIKTTNEDGGGVFIDDQSRGLSPTDF